MSKEKEQRDKIEVGDVYETPVGVCVPVKFNYPDENAPDGYQVVSTQINFPKRDVDGQPIGEERIARDLKSAYEELRPQILLPEDKAAGKTRREHPVIGKMKGRKFNP